jgi:hypothetical protein
MNAIKATLSWFLPKEETRPAHRCTVHPRTESNGQRFRKAFVEGKLDERIRKAEIDYENGRALDRLY